MKVCTDACLFGAYVAKQMASKDTLGGRCLDIGTGTGLLSLMVAQETSLSIDAVEIGTDAFNQAGENIVHSAFKDRIKVYHQDIADFTSPEPYDFILTNPPFYENDLSSLHANKNIAKHSAAITLVDSLQNISRLLKEEGTFYILLPYHRVDYFEEQAVQQGFYLQTKLLVRQTPKHSYFRGILSFSRKKQYLQIPKEELVIKNEDCKYTKNFSDCMKEYYKNL